MRRDRASYGVDGGYFGVPFFVLVGAGLLAGDRWATRRDKRLVGAAAKVAAVALPGVAAGYFYSTGPGKRSVWKELLDDLGLRGDEQVLDIGCGRGAVLIPTARRLPRGRATGSSTTAPSGTSLSFRSPDARASRFVSSAGARRSAFPAIT